MTNPHKKLGSPLKPDKQRNCLACERYSLCLDPSKSWRYACSKFRRLPELDLGDSAYDTALSKSASKTPAILVDEPVKAVRKKHTSSRLLEEMVNEALDSGFDVPPDLRVDDRDLPMAPNFYEWLVGRDFVASDVMLFPKQIQIAMHLLGHYCPKCSDPAYVDNVPFDTKVDEIWSRVVLLRHGKCPRCKGVKSAFVHDGDMNEYYALATVAGQRSGKSLLTSFLESYQLHHWLKAPNAQALYGIMGQQMLTATYVALTFNQARENVFDVIKNYLDASPWFKNLHQLLDEVGQQQGTQLYAFKDIFFRYSYRNIIAAPSGPNKRSLRGRSRFCLAADTLVSVRGGGTLRIDDEDLLGAKAQVLGSEYTIKARYYNGDEEMTYSVVTDCGARVHATIQHRFPVFNALRGCFEERRVDELTYAHALMVCEKAYPDDTKHIETPVFCAGERLVLHTRNPGQEERMRKVFAHEQFALWKSFSNCGLRLSRVAATPYSVHACKTYDITVDKVHLFMANGILTHNSSAIDELGWIPFGTNNKDKTRMSAEEVYTSLDRSMLTLKAAHSRLLKRGHNNLPKPIISAISSPSEVNDHIMQLYRDGLGSKETYAFKAATWEFNPNLTKDDLASAFRRDEAAAMRDYGAEPPMSSSAWITEASNVSACFSPKRRNRVSLNQYRFKSKAGAFRSSGRLKLRHDLSHGRVLSLDAGLVNNAFALATSYYDHDSQRVVIDGLAEIQGSHTAPVSFQQLYADVLLPLCVEFGCRVVVADAWQSLKLLEDLQADAEITSFTHKCKYPDFSQARDAFYEKRIILPRLEMPEEDVLKSGKSPTGTNDYPARFAGMPAAHLFYQIMTVRDFPGKTVEKGAGSTDDLFRTMILAHWACTDREIQDLLETAVEAAKSTIIGTVVSGTSRGGAMSTPFGATTSRAAHGKGDSVGSRIAQIEGNSGGVVGMAASRKS